LSSITTGGKWETSEEPNRAWSKRPLIETPPREVQDQKKRGKEGRTRRFSKNAKVNQRPRNELKINFKGKKAMRKEDPEITEKRGSKSEHYPGEHAFQAIPKKAP